MFGWGLSGYRSDVDAMSLLRAEHKIVEALFKQFEQAGDGAAASKRRIVKNIIKESSVPAAIEPDRRTRHLATMSWVPPAGAVGKARSSLKR